MKRILFITLLLLFGCATKTKFGNYVFNDNPYHYMPAYKILKKYDSMEEFTRISQNSNGSITSRYGTEPFHALNLHLIKYDKKNKNDILLLEVQRKSHNWSFISELKIKTDTGNKVFSWDNLDRKTKIISPDVLIEWVYIPITKKELKELILSKKISARIYGSEGYNDLPIMEYVQDNWKKFYIEYLK